MLTICEYQAAWPDEFREIASRLRHGLGATALRIDHIGSTAVVGLAAKDVIDVQITVAALNVDVLNALAALGCVHVPTILADHRPPNHTGPDDDWQKWFFRAPSGHRATNTHARVAGRANQRYSLLFRDYLRAQPATAAAYAELKRRLACQLRDDADYPDVKDPAVDLIYLAAEAWAETNRWQMPSSDA